LRKQICKRIVMSSCLKHDALRQHLYGQLIAQLDFELIEQGGR